MKYAEEACFVYGAGDLFKVHHVMTAATFGGEEAVLNCMCVVLVRMSMMCGCGSTSVAYLLMKARPLRTRRSLLDSDSAVT